MEPTVATDAQRRPIDIEDYFYEILAGGTKLALLNSVVDLKLEQLMHQRGELTADQIVDALALDRMRGRKWVLLLEQVGLLTERRSDGSVPGLGTSPDAVRYTASPLLWTMSEQNSPAAYFYREFMRYWRLAASYDIVSLIRGAHVAHPVRYPPVAWDDVVLLHEWMRSGALMTLESVERRFDFSGVTRLLDVGGGDATMATQFARNHPGVQITVFNLPQPAYLARQNIAAAQLEDRINVVEGDFRVDTLPTGYDMVMFSRVLADWSPEVCRRLLTMARASLLPNGRLLLCEPLRDQNPDLAIAWEHSYLPYDDFGAYVYKPLSFYQTLMIDVGFTELVSYPRDATTIHGILVGRRTLDAEGDALADPSPDPAA